MNPESISRAVRLLGAYTGDSFDVGRLAGPASRAQRAQVLGILRGEKIPASKAGVNALESAFFAAIEPAGNCLATRRRDFADKCRELLANCETCGGGGCPECGAENENE